MTDETQQTPGSDDSEPLPAWRRLPRNLVRAAAVTAPMLLIALLIYGVVAQSPNTGIDDGLARQRATPAPGFKLAVLQRGRLGADLGRRLGPALADGHVSRAELRGTPIVLNFWASWCIPCRDEAPLLQRTWRQRGRPHGVLFLGLNMQDVTDDARSFMREFDIDYLNIRDPNNAVARSYGVRGLPETYFITPRGNVVGHVIGVVTAAQLRRGIAAARRGQLFGALRGGAQKPTR